MAQVNQPECDTEQHEDEPSDSDPVSEDGDDENYYDGMDELEEVYSPHPMHAALERDIQLFNKNISMDYLSYRSLDELNEMDLEFSFPLSFMERSTTDAWGLIYGKPVIVKLSINQGQYLASEDVLKTEVFQTPGEKRTGALYQLKKIVDVFCHDQFTKLSNSILTRAINGHPTASVVIPPNKDVSRLREMGFLDEDIAEALRLSDGTLEGALNFLVSSEEMKFKRRIENIDRTGDDASGASKADPAPVCPSLRHGFLVQFYHYVQMRLATLNNYCPICDEPHGPRGTAMLKPVVCDKTLCIFSSQTLGVMSDISQIIKTQPRVVDLLIHLTTAAVDSSRCKDILSPYPALIDPNDRQGYAMAKSKRDDRALKTVLRCVPAMSKLLYLEEAELRTSLASLHALCYPLLRWIVSSNRSHIVVLPPEEQLDFMGTKHQFVLLNSPPVQDRRFRAHKQKHGSIFAFHGSPIENWHSILREGLLVASGTSKQLHGAAYGKGIYISPTLSLSLSYCRETSKPKEVCDVNTQGQVRLPIPEENIFIKGSSRTLTCVALCEVINTPSLKKHNTIWVCDSSEHICTRFFFLFDKESRMAERSVNMAEERYMTKVTHALAHIGMT